MRIANDIYAIGVDDHQVDLFEGQYSVPDGMSYNSYVILDEKVAVMDTVDRHFTAPWLENLSRVLDGRKPDYLVVQHMEPDHSANVDAFLEAYPEATVVASAKAFAMMQGFFGTDYVNRRLVVKEGDTLPLGRRTLAFVAAPMVHWPEVILTYDALDGILFSADAFGRFGASDAWAGPWEPEARRYYFGIVGKFGPQVQALLKKAAALDIRVIAPLHGPVLKSDIGRYVQAYLDWSAYKPSSEGTVIAYSSVYGHTAQAVELLAQRLEELGCPEVQVWDLARCDMSAAVADAFRCRDLVLATTTYNGGIFPCVRDFIHHLTDRNFQNRHIAFLENGAWAPQAAKVMGQMLENSKGLTFADTVVTLRGGLTQDSRQAIDALTRELTACEKQ